MKPPPSPSPADEATDDGRKIGAEKKNASKSTSSTTLPSPGPPPSGTGGIPTNAASAADAGGENSPVPTIGGSRSFADRYKEARKLATPPSSLLRRRSPRALAMGTSPGRNSISSRSPPRGGGNHSSSVANSKNATEMGQEPSAADRRLESVSSAKILEDLTRTSGGGAKRQVSFSSSPIKQKEPVVLEAKDTNSSSSARKVKGGKRRTRTDVMLPFDQQQEEVELALHQSDMELSQHEVVDCCLGVDGQGADECSSDNVIMFDSRYDGSTLTDGGISSREEVDPRHSFLAIGSLPNSLKLRTGTSSSSSMSEQSSEESEEEGKGQEHVLASSDDVENGPAVIQVSKSPTKLHWICKNASTLEDLLLANDHLSAATAASTDEQGRTPMHLISLNHNLSNLIANLDDATSSLGGGGQAVTRSGTGGPGGGFDNRLGLSLTRSHSTGASVASDAAYVEEQVIDFIIARLWRVYRAAMITPDREGNIPFQEELKEWVVGSHYNATNQSSTRANANQVSFWKSSRSFRAPWSNKAISQGNDCDPAERHQQDNENSFSATPVRDVENPNSPLAAIGKSFNSRTSQGNFPIVQLTPHAFFCFKLLSAMIERMDRRLQTGRGEAGGRRPTLIQTPLLDTSQANADDDGFATAVSELNNMTVEDVVSEIIQSIASVPDLVKTVLLIDDDRHRNLVLSTLVMRRILASKYSIGNGWLTKMLQCPQKRVSDRALDYLQIVSDTELFEKKSRNDSSWRRSKKSLRSSFNSNNSCSRQQSEDELYNEISRLQDFVPSLLCLGERDVEEAVMTAVVTKVLDHLISRPFVATVVLCDAVFLSLLIAGLRVATNHLLLGSSSGTIMNFLYMANTGLFYFIIRELGKAISFLMMTNRVREYIWSFWNLTDILSTILAAVSAVVIRATLVNADRQNEDVPLHVRNLVAVATGLLWLRVLSFLKGINMQLATFVLAILQITRDVLWFCVILLVLVVAFSQMFFTVLSPQYCSAPSADGANLRECTPSEYYLSVYAILLGDFGTFEREHFTTAFSVVLVILFSFIVVLVLLNVLIAVASDSYEKCLIR